MLLREYFFESLLADLLKKVRTSREALKEWQDKVDGKQDVAEKPVEVTVESILAALRPYLPKDGSDPFLKLLQPERALSRKEWEALPDIADVNFTIHMFKVTGRGEYAPVPIPLHRRLSRALAENLEYTR